MDDNGFLNSDLSDIFDIVKGIYSMQISNIEKEFSNIRKDLFGDYIITIKSNIISYIGICIKNEKVFRIEVDINLEELKLRDIKSYLKTDYDVGFNIHDEETFFNFKLLNSRTINAIHFGLLPTICDFSDKSINRIRFNFG